MRRRHQARPLAALLAILPASGAFACATCGCSLSSEAAMGYSAAAGWQLGLEYTYLDQDQLRFGTGAVSPSQAAAVNNAGGSQEVENRTTTRYLTLDVAYAPSASWNFRALIPYLDRSHTTYGQASNPLTQDQVSGAHFSTLGDAKVIASYQGFLPTRNLGVQLGLKLPTGDYGGPNADGTGIVGRRPVAFDSGPNARQPSPGNLLDTSLQPGTGSTDLILGAYYYQPVSQNFDAFVSGQFQSAVKEALDQPGADYRPGNLATVTFGLRYEANPTIVPQVQVNTTWKSHDQGALADVRNSAGTAVYLSPGVTMSLGGNTSVYGFVQLPVYSRLDGYQLFPHWTATVGVSHGF
jgi:hypothetical protein